MSRKLARIIAIGRQRGEQAAVPHEDFTPSHRKNRVRQCPAYQKSRPERLGQADDNVFDRSRRALRTPSGKPGRNVDAPARGAHAPSQPAGVPRLIATDCGEMNGTNRARCGRARSARCALTGEDGEGGPRHCPTRRASASVRRREQAHSRAKRPRRPSVPCASISTGGICFDASIRRKAAEVNLAHAVNRETRSGMLDRIVGHGWSPRHERVHVEQQSTAGASQISARKYTSADCFSQKPHKLTDSQGASAAGGSPGHRQYFARPAAKSPRHREPEGGR